jgi:hypothetical protein
MKTILALVFVLMWYASTAHAAGCLYLVEAHAKSKKVTFLSDIVELAYPAGSTKCNFDSSGNYLRREQNMKEQFFHFIRSSNPGLDISEVVVKRFDNENEVRIIQQLSNALVASGQPDARGNRVVLMSGRFYSE